MSLSTRLTAAFGRVGSEIKSIHTQLNLTDQYAKRWEQEILSQSGTRTVGFGPVPYGLYVPYNIQLQGVHYRFESPTTSGDTKAKLCVLADLPGINLTDIGFSMNIPANANKQTVTDTAVNVNAGSRLVIEVTNAGGGTIGRGLYVSMWGVYR